ncbi:hypothetical Protein YC6258_01974 [Gynuella sunshinyii YC6258]|uniref:Uncharacterized protein n=1 Tax=Gynuella sunshinyii YC6258 TaxID=1445510 RepID=A0A0C5VKV0_9GAMM|nr:hypothetical Protein YC6258_01974 [Gynuella sunshinyii YC6258]
MERIREPVLQNIEQALLQMDTICLRLLKIGMVDSRRIRIF